MNEQWKKKHNPKHVFKCLKYLRIREKLCRGSNAENKELRRLVVFIYLFLLMGTYLQLWQMAYMNMYVLFTKIEILNK